VIDFRFIILLILSVLITVEINFKPWYLILQNQELASPVLFLTNTRGGSSSAVHIGNGYILTSYHGLLNDRIVTLTTSDGVDVPAVYLWSDENYDIALYRSEDTLNINSYTLDCRPLQIHDQLYFVGNPMMMRNVTLNGTVIGNPIYNLASTWNQVVPVQAPLVPGISGGAAIDRWGRLRGINIGTLIHNQGYASYSYTGLSYIVPGEVICMLLEMHHDAT
jgi:S1-C subfamily serine protease